MIKKTSRTLAIASALALAASAAALASGAMKGKTYEGGAPSTGNSEGHRLRTHTSGNIVLRVSGSGRAVTVRFASNAPILYCITPQRLKVQTTRPASISHSGSFTAAVGQRFAAGPGAPAIVQVVKGRFSGRSVRGTISTHAGEYCSGVANFYAAVR
jgi:hypothetical protein